MERLKRLTWTAGNAVAFLFVVGMTLLPCQATAQWVMSPRGHQAGSPVEGTPVAWGSNSYGEAGGVQPVQSSVPAQITALDGIVDLVTGGRGFVLAVDSGGDVWSWGANWEYELGDGTQAGRSVPLRVDGVAGAVKVAAGFVHSIALLADHTLMAWGSNWSGQLGDGTTGGFAFTPQPVPGIQGVTRVAAGRGYTLALKSDGTVWAWGDNRRGQLGDGTNTDRNSPTPVPGLSGITAIAAGFDQSMALKADGTVWAWGRNDYGQLGDGTNTDSNVPVQVSGLKGVTAIASGGYHSLALKNDGTVWAWGRNNVGQLGDGTYTSRPTPAPVHDLTSVTHISAGGGFNLAVKSDGLVFAWGDDTQGQCGGGPFDTFTTPVQVMGLPSAAQVIAGESDLGWSGVSLALTATGKVYVWGIDDGGQFGNGWPLPRLTPATVVGLTSASAIALGLFHGLALLPDGTVVGWGENNGGQLGTGGLTFSSPVVPVAGLTGVAGIAAGSSYSLAVKQDGTVWSWGNGPHGDETWGPRLLPGKVPGLAGFTAVATGGDGSHCLALKSDGTVWAWGANGTGELGDGTTTDRLTPVQVRGLTNVVAISTEVVSYSSYALDSGGRVWAWGDNSLGQLADGTTDNKSTPVPVSGLGDIVAIAAGGEHCLALDGSGNVWAWGWNSDGQVGDGTFTDRHAPVQVNGLTDIAQIAAADQYSMALRSDGTVWTWGVNSVGQLANGSTTHQNTPGQILALGGALLLAGGGDFGMAMLSCFLDCSASVPASAPVGVPATFSATATPGLGCTGSPSFLWDFGDGTTSTDANSAHAYVSTGQFTWTITASLGSFSRTQTGTITIVPPPVISLIKKASSPFHLVVTGSNLQNGVQVLITGSPWSTVTSKSTSKLIIGGGSVLKAKVPKGVPTQFRFINPDGGAADYTWQWP